MKKKMMALLLSAVTVLSAATLTGCGQKASDGDSNSADGSSGQPVELTPREFALLETLMRNRGAAVYRDTLMERAWGGDAECTRAVDTYITRLRKKLDWGDKIETVYQIGYRLKLE